MGNQAVHKDPNIDIFLELKASKYQAGKQVSGCIYIRARQYSQYSQLKLRFECCEKSQIKTIKSKCFSKKIQILAQEARTTYFSQTVLEQYLNGFYKGDYQVRFTFTIPFNVPGSMILGQNNYVRYKLTAYLQTSNPEVQNQFNQKQLWVLQPFRLIPQSLSVRQTLQAKCCSIFCCQMWGVSYGCIQILIDCDKNAFQPGEKLKTKCQIITTRVSNNSQIKYTKIALIQKQIIFAQEQSKQTIINQHFQHDFSGRIITAGESLHFDRQILLPFSLRPTTIGQLLAHVYAIQVTLQLSCWTQVKFEVPIFVKPSSSFLTEDLSKNLPENYAFYRPSDWKPSKKYPHKLLDTPKPYEYVKPEILPEKFLNNVPTDAEILLISKLDKMSKIKMNTSELQKDQQNPDNNEQVAANVQNNNQIKQKKIILFKNLKIDQNHHQQEFPETGRRLKLKQHFYQTSLDLNDIINSDDDDQSK